MKDNFSRNSESYAKFRPRYPAGLFDFLFSLIRKHNTAWDCGTGNGQVAGILADHFEKVFATDISENQIKNAIRKSNIEYRIERAEHTSFPNNTFDLITVAQAIHWFDFDKFYDEVNRTLNQDGVIAVIGYALITIDNKVDMVINKFYSGTLDGYWDPERRYMDENYLTIPFPFQEIQSPKIKMEYEWAFDELIGFLNTWSAVHHYVRANNKNPVDDIEDELKEAWNGKEKKTVTFPLLLRVGKKL